MPSACRRTLTFSISRVGGGYYTINVFPNRSIQVAEVDLGDVLPAQVVSEFMRAVTGAEIHMVNSRYF